MVGVRHDASGSTPDELGVDAVAAIAELCSHPPGECTNLRTAEMGGDVVCVEYEAVMPGEREAEPLGHRLELPANGGQAQRIAGPLFGLAGPDSSYGLVRWADLIAWSTAGR